VTRREALAATITRGNPIVPKLRRWEWPSPVILKYAGVRTWSAFQRGMPAWETERKDGTFRMAGNTKRPNGMWLGTRNKQSPFRREPQLMMSSIGWFQYCSTQYHIKGPRSEAGAKAGGLVRENVSFQFLSLRQIHTEGILMTSHAFAEDAGCEAGG